MRLLISAKIIGVTNVTSICQTISRPFDHHDEAISRSHVFTAITDHRTVSGLGRIFTLDIATLKISLSDVRLNPEGGLEDHRLPPCIVHAIDDFR